MHKFKIAWMFPDTLYLHGDRGNPAALERFARLYGAEPELHKIDFETETFIPSDYDVIYFGAGEISSFAPVCEWLRKHKESLETFIADGRPLISSGTTTGLFCRDILRLDGERISGLGLLDAEYVEREAAYGDDLLFKTTYCGEEMEIAGCQIQMGDLILGDEEPFGNLIYGYGNNGRGRDEGIKKECSVFTNTLGPMLVCNPWLTDVIVKQALIAAGCECPQNIYDDALERSSFDAKRNFILNKKTHLKNCRR